MRSSTLAHRPLLASLALTSVAAAWWGCAQASDTHMTEATTTTTTTTTSSGSGGSGGSGGVNFDGGGGSDDDGGTCTSTSAAAHKIPLDIVFLIDQSGSMHGTKWMGITTSLNTFVNDPASIGIGAGLTFFPAMPWDCNPFDYENLLVPIDILPNNSFALMNAFPAVPQGAGTPMYGALEGTLMAATAYQDANPMHKVIVVLATDGDPNGNGCDISIPDIAALAKSALDYDGVQTYVIGCAGSTIANLDAIAAGGGTTAAYDVTVDITQFAAKMAEIRTVALGCDFAIPPPPNGEQLNPDEVNFTYQPMGMGTPTTLLRAKDLADCNGQPGWYYDNNMAPTKIELCPASCSTVEADVKGVVNVLFGCKSEFK